MLQVPLLFSVLVAADLLGAVAGDDTSKSSQTTRKSSSSTWKDFRSGGKDAGTVSVSLQSQGSMSNAGTQADLDSVHPSLVRKDPKNGSTVSVSLQSQGAMSNAPSLSEAETAQPAAMNEEHRAGPDAVKSGSSQEIVSKDKAPRNVFEFDDDDAEDAALDELEALTIANAMLHKHSRRRRRRRIDCKWSPWTDGKCSKTCGMGTKTKTRKMAPKKAHGGKDCNGDPSKDEPCDVGDCPADPTPAPTPAATTTAAFATQMAATNAWVLLSLASATALSYC